jgi:hypothetical protein
MKTRSNGPSSVEDAELENELRLLQSDEKAEERTFERTNRHLRHILRPLGLLAEPAQHVGRRRRVLSRVLVRLLEREAHSTLPTRTQPLCPPSPIALDNATSTCNSRATFGT